MAAWYVVALCVAKAAVVLLSLRSGSYGGTLTPGLALGAAAAFSVAALVLWAFPALGGVPGGASMVLYAAALTGYGGVFGYFDECAVVCVDVVDWFYGSGCECVAADGGCGGHGGADPLGVDTGVRR